MKPNFAHKHKYAEDELGVESKEELQYYLDHFHCKTEKELIPILKYDCGLTLVNNIDEYRNDFKFDFYNAVAAVCADYCINKGIDITEQDINEAIDWFRSKFFED